MGQGQYGSASKHLSDSITHGNWIVLENCHLDRDLTLRICVEYQCAIDADNVHEDFRFCCVTAPTSEFPIVVLRQATKFTCNPPNNLKERVLRHVDQLNDDKHLRWNFALVTFHAVLQERKAFDATGWNRPYSFNDHLLRQTMTYLKSFIKIVDDSIAFDGIAYLVTECIYGGYVIDKVDRRLLRSLFQQICCDSTTTFFENASIHIPVEMMRNSCIEAIDTLSSHETSAADVGLHTNTEFERGSHQCDYILSTLARSASTETRILSADSVQHICDDILSCLPKSLPVICAYADNTFGLIRRYETMYFNELLQCMRATLTELHQAINGDIHMIDDLYQIYCSLQSNRIPSLWFPLMYRTSMSLAPFVQDLIRRVEFFRRWDNDSPSNRFWFAAFYNPEALVTGIKTMYAIDNDIDLNDVYVQCTVSIENAHKESILIEVSAQCPVPTLQYRFFSSYFFFSVFK